MSFYNDASLVLIPSGTKEGVVFSQKPTNGDGDFTFTRASSATRVNSDGLIEKETQNLLLQSNSFNTTWANSSTTETGGQSGYDGSSDAWLLSKSAAGGYIYQDVTTSGVVTASIYLKAGTTDWVNLTINGTSSFAALYGDLTNGVIVTTQGADYIDSSIESVGGGWYRVSITAKGGTTRVRIYPADADNDVSGSSGNIYIQDAQLEQGLVARDYSETTTTAVYGGITDNIPRLDYTDASCPSLLLEPQRTNIIESSEFFDASSYGFANLNTEANSTISPEGVKNAYKLIPNTTNGVHLITNLTSNNAVYSVFAKQGGYKRFRFNSSSSGDGFASYDLDLGQVVGSGGTYYIDSGIVDYGNGWYRCYLVLGATPGGVTTMAMEDNSGSVAFIGDGTSGIYVYGMQVEQATYPTSYIPTYGASVTRVGDACSKTGISSLIGDSEGTLYLDSSVFENDTDTKFISLSDGSSDNRIDVRFKGNGDIQFTVRVGASTVSSITTPYIANTNYKIAAKYANNNFALWVNGVEVGTDNSGSTFASGVLTDIDTNDADGGNFFYGNVKQLIVFPTALSNTELAALTTI